MSVIQEVLSYLENNKRRFEEELFEFLRFPSVSASPNHVSDVRNCADWLVERFCELGLSAEVMPTGGQPAVVAETKKREGLPTVLVYGHYDVQPEDPVDLWTSPPFEPVVRDGVVYARGATDDKGQLYTHLKATEAWIRVTGETPINLIFLLEGEEEVGSPHLEEFLAANRERFQADAVIISDTSMFSAGYPALCYALRGLTYMEFIVTGANQDLHSGMFGGVAPNPTHVIANIISAFKNPDGSIAIPGFYEGVKDPEEWEVREFEKLPWDYEEMANQLGLPHLSGESAYPVPVRKWYRPTLDINGIYGGYAGKGAKTVIPSQAGAKVSMRLVPGQNPERIADLTETFIRERIPSECQVEIIRYQSSPAIVIPVDDPAMKAGREAYHLGFGKEPLFIREGASIPVVGYFVDEMKMSAVLFGFGLPDDNPHAPNEKFTLADYHRGIATSAHFQDVYARVRA